VRQQIRRARWTVRSRLAEHPAYLSVAQRKYGHMVLGDGTELVIDGFTRSANVYAVIAFQQAQTHPVRVAHLLHSPGHLVAAAQRGVPAVLTIREPRRAVISCMIREPFTTAPQLLTAWIRFHERLLPWRERLVVAEFNRVTSDLGSVVEEVNDRFDTSFDRVHDGPETSKRAFALIEERAARPAWDRAIGLFMSGLIDEAQLAAARDASAGPSAGGGPAVAFEHRVARPSTEREQLARRLDGAYDDERLAAARRRAELVFTSLTSHPA
jgi:hypothetical protein